MRSHQDLDERSLALHRLIAAKIQREPALFERARSTLTRWRQVVDESSQPYLQQWEALLEAGPEAALAVATEDSEQATALRQSSPFCGVLTHRERFEFFRSWASR